jgi:aminopeptidase N
MLRGIRWRASSFAGDFRVWAACCTGLLAEKGETDDGIGHAWLRRALPGCRPGGLAKVVDGVPGLKDGFKMSALRWMLFLVCLLLVAAGPTASAESPFSFATTPGQLPKTVVPRHYDLQLRPDLEKFTTRGSVVIDIEVLKPVREIVLNALDLEITKASLLDPKETALAHRLDADKQTLVLPLPTEIAPGNHRLLLEFNGRITAQAQGLFYVKYAAPSGKKVMLATQMEATDARRMFPCWDEPVFRATFELSVVVPQRHLAVSNMPIMRETALEGAFKKVKFARTPPMASYLVVLVSGELEELKGRAEGVPIRIITTEGKREQGLYALEATKKLLTYYNQYFGIKYRLPKLDQIAIPGGYTGAMENWGGITYNERVLLFDPKTSSQETKQNVFGVVAHEMAHQWFGDLVTMAWWDNLWLNEGFASWMGTKATDHFNPEWQVWLMADSEKTTVMSEDSRKTTHPIQQRVENESQANDAFDHITYKKGQAFLRMLESYLGEKEFRQGIRRYLSDHRYSNTTTADLWGALEKVSGKPVQAISAGWTEQPGLPVVQVKTGCVNGKQVVTLEQERFTVQDPGARPLQWKIPVALMETARSQPVQFALLEGKSISVPFGDCQAVIKANAGDAGYYRVSYAPGLLEKLKINELPVADRLNLLNDRWAMVEANRASARSYLELVESFRNEKAFAIWSQLFSGIDFIAELERGQPGRAAFQQYASTLLQLHLQRLGWEPKSGEPSTDVLLRSAVITRLGEFGDRAVIAEARARYENFLVNPGTLTANLRPPVLKIVGRYSDRATYDKIHELARKAKGTEERRLYYRAMAGALDPDLAKTTLALSLTDETVPQETTHLVIDVADSGEQEDLAWDYAKAHMKELLGGVDGFRRNNYVPSILAAFSDATRADELEAYVKANVSEDALVKAKETAERIRLKAALKQRELPVIDQWVAARLGGQGKIQ